MYEKCKIWVDFSDFDQMQFLNSITQSVAFEFWHFSPIFVLLKLNCLVTLFDCAIDHFGILKKLLCPK